MSHKQSFLPELVASGRLSLALVFTVAFMTAFITHPNGDTIGYLVLLVILLFVLRWVAQRERDVFHAFDKE